MRPEIEALEPLSRFDALAIAALLAMAILPEWIIALVIAGRIWYHNAGQFLPLPYGLCLVLSLAAPTLLLLAWHYRLPERLPIRRRRLVFED